MSILFSPNVLRAVLLAIVLACAAAVFAPAARGASGEISNPKSQIPIQTHRDLGLGIWDLGFGVSPAVAAFPAEEWSWNEFIKYWGRQFGSLQGVVGTVMLVALAAVIIILSKGRSYMAK